MGDLFLPSERQIARIEAYFPLSQVFGNRCNDADKEPGTEYTSTAMFRWPQKSRVSWRVRALD